MKERCEIQSVCQICPYVNLDYDSSLLKKSKTELDVLKKNKVIDGARVLRVVPSPRKMGYRTIFKLAVRRNHEKNSSERYRLGLFNPGTHRMGPSLIQCPLHSSSLRSLLKKLQPLLEKSTLEPYDEENHRGDIRYLIGRSTQGGEELLLTWVVTQNCEKEIAEISEELKKQEIPIKVVAMNIHPEKSNAIWGVETKLLTKASFIEEEVMGLSLRLGPTSFFQVNPFQAENIYRRVDQVAKKYPKKTLAWDLYSGVGPFSLVLARNFERVISLEENQEAVNLAKGSAKKNGFETKIECLSGLVEQKLSEFPESAKAPDLIVVNPSRRGIHQMGRELIVEAMKRNEDCELIYVSCDVDSFARDLSYFQKQGIKVFEIQGFDMMAHTDQLEWMGRLSKN